MTTTTQRLDAMDLDDFRRPIHQIALSLTRNEDRLQDFEQEMACHFLTLPPGHTRSWYLTRLCSRVRDYRDRKMIDAPMGDNGRPIPGRRTICVGGLRELDQIHRRQAA